MSYIRTFILSTIIICMSSSCLANSSNYSGLQLAKEAESIDEAISILDATETKLLGLYNSNHNINDGLALANVYYSKGKLYISTLATGADTKLEAKARKQLENAATLFGKIEKEANKKCIIEEKRLGSRYARTTPLWKKLREIFLQAKLSSAWCNFYLSELALDGKAKEHLNTALQKFNYFHKNGFSIQPIILNSYIGSASCWLEANRPRLALKDLGDNEITPLNIDLDIFRQIALIKAQAYDKISSSIGVEDTTKQYFDMLEDLILTNSKERELAKLRLENLAKLSTNIDSNPYYKTHLKRFYKFTSALYYNGFLRNEILSISKEYNIQSPCCYYKHCIELINSNNIEAIEAIEAFLKDDDNSRSPFVRELHQKLIILFFNEKQYLACFESFWAYVDKFNIRENDEFLSRAALDSGVILLENKHYNLSKDFDKLIKLLTQHNMLTSNDITIARAKALIAKNACNKAISLLDKETFEPANIDRAALLRAIAYFKLSLINQRDSREEDYLRKSKDLLTEINLKDTNMLPNEISQAKQLIVSIAKKYIETPLEDYHQAQETLRMLGDSNNREAMLLEMLIDSKNNNIASLENRLEELKANKNLSKFEFELFAKIAENLEGAITYSGWEIDSKSKQTNLLLISIYKTMLKGNKDTASKNNKTILLNKLANSYYYASKINDALEIFNKLNSLSLLDTTTKTLYNLADSLERSNRVSDAIRYWKLLSRRLPKFCDQWYEINERLILAWASCNQGELAQKYLDYFLAKYEDQMPTKWQQKFKTLSRRI